MANSFITTWNNEHDADTKRLEEEERLKEEFKATFKKIVSDPKYKELSIYISQQIDAMKDKQKPKNRFDLNLEKFSEYTDKIKGWQDNIDNNNQVISVLISDALSKAKVSRTQITSCSIKEKYFKPLNNEFPLAVFKYCLSFQDKGYDASKKEPHTNVFVNEDAEEHLEELKKLTTSSRQPIIQARLGELKQYDESKEQRPVKHNKSKNNVKNVNIGNRFTVYEIDSNQYNNKLNTLFYRAPNKSATYPRRKGNQVEVQEFDGTPDQQEVKKFYNTVNQEEFQGVEDGIINYDFTSAKSGTFSKIYNVLYNLDVLSDDGIKELAKTIGNMLMKGNENKNSDDELADYAIRTLRQFIILHSKGSDDTKRLINDNDEMIGIFRKFFNRCYDKTRYQKSILKKTSVIQQINS